MCCGFLSCVWSDHSKFMALFMLFNMLIGPGFVLILAVNFNFSVAIFQLLPLD
jgi:hypothetical protein